MERNKDDEGNFLHDLANPVSTALILMDVALENIHMHLTCYPDELHQLRSVLSSLDQVKNLIQERKIFLQKRGVPHAES